MATIDKSFVPLSAVHPYDLLKDELEVRELTQKNLAERIGMKASNLSVLIKERKPITPAMAGKLEDALDVPAEIWLGMQAQYDRDLKAIEARDKCEQEATIQERILADRLNLKQIFKALGVHYTKASERMQAIWTSFDVDTPTALMLRCQVYGLYKKSDRCLHDDKNMNTWLLLADLATRRATADAPYHRDGAKQAAQRIAELTHSGEISEMAIKATLSEYGIGYAVVPKLDKVPVDGYSRYGDYPCIVVTHRYNDLHKLVFVVLHELGHIHLHLDDDSSRTFASSLDGSDSPLEDEANAFARDTLIDRDTWRKMMQTTSKSIYPAQLSKLIQRQAERYGVSTHIALYRFQYETGNYKLPRPKAVPIS